MRKDTLCAGLTECPDSVRVECPDGAVEYDHCATCSLLKLEHAFATEKGHRIQTAFELIGLSNAGLTVNWDSLSADEADAVVIVAGERQRLETEKHTDGK